MVDQRVIAITGTSRGIGLGMAGYFLRVGCCVAGCSRGPAVLAAADYFHTQVDVTAEKEVRSWVRAVKNHFGRIDVLVCNAATIPSPSLLTATSSEVLDMTLRTNIFGTYLVCREVAKVMMLQHSGRIITISSMAAALHDEGTSAYAASKSAVVEFTKVLAKELAPLGITCNVIAPSVYRESAVSHLGEAVVDNALERLTIKRELTIEDICKVVEFFAAPESGCITGQILSLGLVT